MIADNFTDWLELKGFGMVGTNLFDNFQPDSPDNLISTYDVNAPSISESSSLSVDQYAIQIIVRNTAKAAAKENLMNIHKKFMGFSGRLVSGGELISMVFNDTPPYSIGKDENGRHEYSAFYRMRVVTDASDNDYRL
jgi:hypothetical protein